VLKCEDKIAFLANKENEMIKCLKFEIVLNLSKSNIVKDRLKKIVRKRRKKQRSKTKIFELLIV